MIDKIWSMPWSTKNRICKSLIYLALAIVVVICRMQYITRNEAWIYFVENNIRGRVFIPKDITGSKDCNKFCNGNVAYPRSCIGFVLEKMQIAK